MPEQPEKNRTHEIFAPGRLSRRGLVNLAEGMSEQSPSVRNAIVLTVFGMCAVFIPLIPGMVSIAPTVLGNWLNLIATFFWYVLLGVQSPDLWRQSISITFFLAIIAAARLTLHKLSSPYRYLDLTPAGIRLSKQQSVYAPGTFVVRWESLSSINLQEPDFFAFSQHRLLSLVAGDRKFLVSWPDVLESIDPSYLLSSIRTWSPNTTVAPEVSQEISSHGQPGYTELWLSHFSTTPKRKELLPLQGGKQLQDGRYEIINRLGVGGQGTAYLAINKHAENTQVVLKEYILPVYSDDSALDLAKDKLSDEARILQNLKHDQVVRLLEYFVEDYRGYLVLEYVAGKNLREVVEANGKLDEKLVVTLAEQVAEIMFYLHGTSPPVIHRDITPENLILQPDGLIKLVDFNVARELDASLSATVVGKHAYIAPEQFRGKPTRQSDIYSLGCTMFFLLTGHDPEPLSQSHPIISNDTVSAEVSNIVAMATDIDLEKRFARAEDLGAALRRLAKD